MAREEPRGTLGTVSGRPQEGCPQGGLTSAGPISSGPTSNWLFLLGPTSRGPISPGPTSSGPTSGTPTSGGPTSAGPTSRGPTSGGPNLREANLTRADLWGADLRGTDLREANLTRANFTRANLSEADLGGADLTMAALTRTNLSGAKVAHARFANTRLGFTVLGDIDFSQAAGLAAVQHWMGSVVGVDTLVNSFRAAGNTLTPELTVFFRGAGVPQELLDALPAIVAEVKYYPCFISYGQPDLAFAQKLYADLEARGVSCWLYAMDATPGARNWKEIGDKRRGADKVLVLCSAPSLIRDGVLKEIEEQIDDDPDKLVPISLDDLWKEKGFRVMRVDRDLKPFLHDRNYADFASLPCEEAMERLLRGLRRQDADFT